ncbi:MAG: CBS domain-containing protein [Dongiaceae bacterium]
MNVETILKSKGRNTVTVAADATIAKAAELLRREMIGAVLVLDQSGALVGILSERDIVHALSEHGASVFGEPVSTVMTRKLLSCGREDTINDLMARMTEARIRHLPVLENGRLCGIVSIGDVVKYRLEEVEFEAGQLRDYVATAG